jgi:hypothetical protein
MYDSEYSLMIDILSNSKEDQIIDIIRESHSGESPVTFGDIKVDEEGRWSPTETQMVKEEDYCIQNCLDYIIEIRRAS